MNRILLLFDRASIENDQADPECLIEQLRQSSGRNIRYDHACYDDLVFSIANGTISVAIPALECIIDDFSLIYFRRFSADQSRAQAVAMYAEARGVQVIDTEILLRKGSVSKLTQYMKMALNDIAIPATITASQSTMRQIFSDGRDDLPEPFLPCVMKLADATRGAANELVQTAEEALRFIDMYPSGEILMQEYLENDGDYRVWVLGDVLGPVFYRQRDKDGVSHKNNTSQGAAISQVVGADEIEPMREIAIRAAQLFHREVAGVDVVKSYDGTIRIFEVNRAPQIEHTQLEEVKVGALAAYLERIAGTPS